MTKFEGVIPILNVKSFAVSLDYYVTKLGFTKKWDWGDPPGFGCVTRGKVSIFLCEGVQGRPGMWMSVFMDNLDALHAEYIRSGATIRMPPTNMPWGSREMNVEDPDGHRLRMTGDSTGAVEDDALERFVKMEQS